MAYQRNGNGHRSAPPQRRQEPQQGEPEQGNGESRQPVQQFNYPTGSGSFIWVSVWASDYESHGKVTTVFSMTYKRSFFHDNQWKTSENCRSHELPVLIYALQQAHHWAMETQREERGSRRSELNDDAPY